MGVFHCQKAFLIKKLNFVCRANVWLVTLKGNNFNPKINICTTNIELRLQLERSKANLICRLLKIKKQGQSEEKSPLNIHAMLLEF